MPRAPCTRPRKTPRIEAGEEATTWGQTWDRAKGSRLSRRVLLFMKPFRAAP
jgi:hypothetical protein